MIELSLFSALYVVGLLVALGWAARPHYAHQQTAELRRVVRAVGRAAATVLLGRVAILALVVGITAALVVVAEFRFGEAGGHGPRWLTTLLAVLAVFVGAITSLVASWFALWATAPLSLATADTLDTATDGTLTTLIRRCGGLVLGIEAGVTLSCALSFGAFYGVLRTTNAASLAVTDLVVSARLTAYFGVGLAVCSAVVSQLGLVCEAAGRMSGGSTWGPPGLVGLDPRNPRVIVDLLALQIGRVLPRILDSVLTSTCLTVAIAVAATLHVSTASTGASWSLLWLPLLVRAFGLLASGFGLGVVRMREAESPVAAVIRGLLVTIVVAVASMVGTSVWLFGQLPWLIVGSGLLGLTLSCLLGAITRVAVRVARRTPPDGSTQGASTHVPSHLTHGLRYAIFGLLGCVTCIWLVQQLDGATGWPTPGTLPGLLLFIVGATVLSPLATTLSVSSSVVEFIRGALGVGQSQVSDDAHRRLARIEVCTHSLTAGTLPANLGIGSLVALLIPLVLSSIHRSAPGPHTAPQGLAPWTVAVMLIAVVPLLVIALKLTESATRTAKTLGQEVERQLRGVPRPGALPQIPADFVPSYRSCVDLFARSTRRGGLIPALAVVVLPLTVAVLSAPRRDPGLFTSEWLAAMATSTALFCLISSQVFLPQSPAASGSARSPSPSFGATPSETPELAGRPTTDAIAHILPISLPTVAKVAALVALAFVASPS